LIAASSPINQNYKWLSGWSAADMKKRPKPSRRPRDLAERYEKLRQLRKQIEELLAAPAPRSVKTRTSDGDAKKSKPDGSHKNKIV
jgi:hypothetical protein